MREWLAIFAIAAACSDPSSTPPDGGVAVDADERLATPTGLVAMPGDSEVVLTWDAVTGATNYRLGRADSAGGARVIISATPERMARDSGRINGVTYFYSVQAANGVETSEWSAEIAAMPVETLPIAPTGFVARAGRTKVTLGWQTAMDAKSYILRRATTSAGPYMTIATLTGPPYVDTDVVDNTTYFYLLLAHNTGGDSAPAVANATPTDAIPAVPSGLTELTGKHETTLEWNATPAATAFRIERSWSQNGPWGFVGLTTGRSITIPDVFGSAWFRVIAVSPAGEGDPSAPILASPSSFYLFPVFSLTGRASRDAVSLAWSADSQQTTFSVRRSATHGGPYVEVASTTKNFYQDSALASGTYYYVVRATNKPGVNSNELKIEVSPTQPQRPTGFVVENNGYAVRLSWQPVPGASHYVVRRTHNRLAPAIIAEPLAPRYWVYLDDAEDVYTVSAVVDGVESAGSEITTHVPGPTYVPTLDALVGSDRIVLTMPTLPMTLYRAIGETADYVAIYTGTGGVIVDDNVTAGVGYRYRTRMEHASGLVWSPEISAQLSTVRPTYPKNVRLVADGYRWAELAWDPVPNARGYRVFIEQAGSLAGGWYASTSQLRITGVEPGWIARVTAYHDAGESAPSDPLTLATSAGPPANAPQNVRAVTGDGYVYVTWSGVEAPTYSIRRSTSPSGPFTEIGTGLYSYTDESVTNGVTYHYVVAAVAGGSELVSASVSARPDAAPLPAPAITTTTISDNEVELAWNPVPGAYAYRVYRGTTAGSEQFYTTAGRPHFVDSLAYMGSTYYYYVTAMTLGSVESAPSNEVSATPTASAQDRVGSSASSGRESLISWTASPGATSYRVWRTDYYSDPWVPIGDVTGLSYSDATPGTHFYAVTAIGPNGASVMSEPYLAYVSPSGLPRVSNVTLDTSNGGAIVSWSPLGTGLRYLVCWRNVTTSSATSCELTSRSSLVLPSWTPGDTLTVAVRVKNPNTSMVYFTPSVDVTATTTGGAPAVPTVTGYTGNPQVALTWNAVSGATSYRIWSAERADDPLRPIATTTDRWYVSPVLRTGVPYAWAVSAVGNGTESNPSPETELGVAFWKQPVTAPIVATGHAGAITFDAGSRDVDSTWQVLVQDTAGVDFTQLTPLARYRGRIVVPAAAGMRTYMLRQCDYYGCSNVRVMTAAPSATASLAVTSLTTRVGNGEVSLMWTPVAGATGYRVYRGPGPGIEGALVPIAIVAEPPFTDRGVHPEMVSTYTITAIGPGGESAMAAPEAAYPERHTGWAPATVTAMSVASGIQITWEPSLGATSYSVCRSTTPGYGYTCVVATSPYLDTTAEVGTAYSYVVSANGGAFSPEVGETRLAQ